MNKGSTYTIEIGGRQFEMPGNNKDNLGIGIYIISDKENDLFEKDEENLVIGYNQHINYLLTADNLEEEFQIFKENNWDTDSWTVKIKYWDYEHDADEDGVIVSEVLYTPFDFWNHWNPSLADIEDTDVPLEESNILLQIISQGENRNLEFKSSLRYCYNQKSPQPYVESEIIKTISAFANTEGGTLIIGVNDDGEILGLQNDFTSFKGNQRDKFLKHFANIIGTGFTEPIDAIIKYGLENSEAIEVFVITVEKSAKPRFMKLKGGEKEFYIRRSATSQKLDIEEAIKYCFDKWSKQ